MSVLVKFTRMDSGRTAEVVAQDRTEAQAVADHYGRRGWVLKDIVDHTVSHQATVRFVGKTIFEERYGLGAKRGWVFTCTCGDEDATDSKAGIMAIALAHTSDIDLRN